MANAGESEAINVDLNFSEVDFIDSSALGMLLFLNDNFTKKGGKVTLSGAQGQVLRIFELSKFTEIFEIA